MKPLSSKWFRVGVVLLVVNVPFGYGAIALCAAVAAATRRPAWLIAGGACYALSWLMLGIGLLLAGPAGLSYVRGHRGRQLRKAAEKKAHASPDGVPISPPVTQSREITDRVPLPGENTARTEDRNSG